MPDHVSNSVRLILKPFLFDYTITKDAQVKTFATATEEARRKNRNPHAGPCGLCMGILVSSSERRRRDLFLAVVVFSCFFGGHPVAAVPTAAVYAFTRLVGISIAIYGNRGAEHALASDFQSGEGGCNICFHFSCVVWLGPLPHARKAWGNGLLVD